MNELFKAYFYVPSPHKPDHRTQTVVPAAVVTLEFDSTKDPQDLLGLLGCQVKMKFNSFFDQSNYRLFWEISENGQKISIWGQIQEQILL